MFSSTLQAELSFRSDKENGQIKRTHIDSRSASRCQSRIKERHDDQRL